MISDKLKKKDETQIWYLADLNNIHLIKSRVNFVNQSL